MDIKGFLNKAKDASGVKQFKGRVSTVLGDAPPQQALTKPAGSTGDFLRSVGNVPRDVPDDWKTIGGLAAGAVLVKKHRVLGAIGGASLARNIPALLHAEERKYALRNLGTTGLAVAGSLVAGKKPLRRVGGFVAGWLVGGIVSYAVGIR